jgi:hypothetical protein
MVLIRRFPDGFEVHGGKLTKEEEADLYRRMAGGPMRILRSRPVLPETAIETREAPPQLGAGKQPPARKREAK